MPHRPSRDVISRVPLLAAYSRAAIKKLVDPEVKRNHQNWLLEYLPEATVSDINGHWEKPTSSRHWIYGRTVSLLETRRQIPPGRRNNFIRRIVRRQVKLSASTDQEAWSARVNKTESEPISYRSMQPKACLLTPDAVCDPSDLAKASVLIDTLASELSRRMECRKHVLIYHTPNHIPVERTKAAILTACNMRDKVCTD
ncbi:hypothetical protein CLF_112329 [Clonorchis sinensis]|uniref:ATP-binding cassette transporter n=1 Tax=Clonorchis sinensis TaxID=79923 RepID=G7YW76_CLOSI|nr:hypothetical protein CLF_112329 [Clonorchis sinensis]